MNPFDLSGPQFLILYAVIFTGVMIVAAWVRWSMRQPGGEPDDDGCNLDRYEIAYLAGGEQLAVNAAIAGLVHAKVLEVSETGGKVSARSDVLREDAHPLEQIIHGTALLELEKTIRDVRKHASRVVGQIADRLRKRGLLVAKEQASLARWLPLLLVLSVVVLGGIKIVIGAARGKPVGILIGACIVSTAVALIGFARAVHRSQRGDRVLGQLKEEHSALHTTVRRQCATMAGADLALAVGLFGMGVLAYSPHTDLRQALTPPSNSGGSGGCGGGCGGGGCGGCGCGGCGD